MQNSIKIRRFFPFLTWPKVDIAFAQRRNVCGHHGGFDDDSASRGLRCRGGHAFGDGDLCIAFAGFGGSDVEFVSTLVCRPNGVDGADGGLGFDWFGATG